MNNDEKVFFEDEAFLVTSKRLVVRETGRTYPLREVSTPRVETVLYRDLLPLSGLEKAILFVRAVVGKFPKHIDTLYEGKHQLVVEWKGKQTVIGEHVYYIGNMREYKPEETEGSPEWKEQKARLLRIAEAIGAALANM